MVSLRTFAKYKGTSTHLNLCSQIRPLEVATFHRKQAHLGHLGCDAVIKLFGVFFSLLVAV